MERAKRREEARRDVRWVPTLMMEYEDWWDVDRYLKRVRRETIKEQRVPKMEWEDIEIVIGHRRDEGVYAAIRGLPQPIAEVIEEEGVFVV